MPRFRADQQIPGYEISEGKYVVLENDEVKAAAGERGKIIHLEEFVDAADIDPVFYDKTYYVGSRDDEDPYRPAPGGAAAQRAGRNRALLFHNREYLVSLRALEGVLALDTLRFHDEVVPAEDLEIPQTRKPSKREAQMAGRPRRDAGQDFKPGDYRTPTATSVLDLIKRKAAGKEIDPLEQEVPAHGDDLGAALEASLSRQRASRWPARSGPARSASGS